MTAIGDLKSRAFTDDAEVSGKGRQPEATLEVKLPATSWTIRIFPVRGEARASVSGRPGAFALATDPAASLQAAFQKAVAPVTPTPVMTPRAGAVKR